MAVRIRSPAHIFKISWYNEKLYVGTIREIVCINMKNGIIEKKIPVNVKEFISQLQINQKLNNIIAMDSLGNIDIVSLE